MANRSAQQARDRSPGAAPRTRGAGYRRLISVASRRGRRRSSARSDNPLFRDRYSRFVGTMKFVLPAAAAVMIAVILIWPSLRGEHSGFRSGFLSRLKIQDIENLTLVKARYVGTDSKDRPYTVTADMARQKSPGSDIVTLSSPAADITLENGSWVALTAKSGAFSQKRKRLDLNGEVSLFHDDGYTFRTDHIRIDLDKGKAVGNDPVVGYGPLGQIKAQGVRILDKGRRIVFTGKAHLVIRPGVEPPQPPAAGGGKAEDGKNNGGAEEAVR